MNKQRRTNCIEKQCSALKLYCRATVQSAKIISLIGDS